MDNAIAYIFERHNIIELKNPNEPLNIDVIWKGISYAAQYKSRGYDDFTKRQGVNAIPMKEVTLTFLRMTKPVALFEEMKSLGYGLKEEFPGVYYISGMADIKMQIVVGNELEGDDFVPLRVQKKNANEDDAAKFIKLVKSTLGAFNKELTDAIFQISMTENEGLYERLRKERPDMCEAMRLFFKNELMEQYNLGSADGYKIGSADGYKTGSADGYKIGSADGYNLGSADGYKTGAAERASGIVRNMILRGYDNDEISALTALPINEIEAERGRVPTVR